MLPWSELVRMALRIGIPPQDFWRLSVREWLWLSAPETIDFSAAQLQALMETYPDG